MTQDGSRCTKSQNPPLCYPYQLKQVLGITGSPLIVQARDDLPITRKPCPKASHSNAFPGSTCKPRRCKCPQLECSLGIVQGCRACLLQKNRDLVILASITQHYHLPLHHIRFDDQFQFACAIFDLTGSLPLYLPNVSLRLRARPL